MLKLFGWIFFIWLIVTPAESVTTAKYVAKGSNVCTRIDRYEKDVVVPKSKLVRKAYQKFCLSLPPLCSYFTYETVYVNETVRANHTRTIYDCCKGYENRYGSCVPKCEIDCGHGECIEPDVCLCEEGWKEPLCKEECEPDTYGRGCTDKCSCLHGASCDKKNGSCHCAPGFTGQFCEYSCPYNTYGLNCLLECKCQNDAFCDVMDGTCECAPGYTGEFCEQKCQAGSHGINCDEECVCLPEYSDSCDRVTGECICKPGYTGIYCERMCGHFSYGEHCSRTCRCAITNTEFCEPTNGSCVCKPGWTGSECAEICPVGKFGEYCNYVCVQCPNASATCNHVTGFCDCPSGSFGDNCHESCPEGTWGSNCTNKCFCLNGGKCDAITGNCICFEGQTGSFCSEVTTKPQQTTTDCDHSLCTEPTPKNLVTDDISRKNETVVIVLVPILLLALLAGLTCALEKKGIISLRKFFMRIHKGPTSAAAASTDSIIGKGLNNPVYGCRYNVEREVSLEGPAFTRFCNTADPDFSSESIRSGNAENTEKCDAEIGDKRLSTRSSKSLWAKKNGQQENEGTGKEMADDASLKFDEDFLSVAMRDLCSSDENKDEKASSTEKGDEK